jgi:CorA-like Mg2+ transporter protein
MAAEIVPPADAGELGANPIRLRAKVATCWDGATPQAIRNLDSAEGLEELRAAAAASTIWIETVLEPADKETEEWFDGSFDVWSSRPNPAVDWSCVSDVLRVLGLPTPQLLPEGGDQDDKAVFMRAIPYGFIRGVFGTLRDAVPDEGFATRLATYADDGRLTAFPTVGFKPVVTDSPDGGSGYRMLRTIVGIVGKVVVTVRLPDQIFAASADGGGERAPDMIRLVLPRRFLPLHRMPSSRDLAEAIGIHQATTARAVAGQIRKCLARHEERARDLADPGVRAEIGPGELFASVRADGVKTEAHAEVAQQLERKIARLLRRLGGADDAPEAARELAPAEVERRYSFALDEVRSLQGGCRLTMEVIGKALMDQEQRENQRFQSIATALASIILVPTLIAGIFGASVHIPTEKSSFGFPVLVVVILTLTAVSYFALRKAQKNDWTTRWGDFAVQIGLTVAVLVGYTAFLIAS